MEDQRIRLAANQMASVATVNDYEKLKKDTEDAYSALSELYNDGDTSDENMSIYKEMQSLLADITVLDNVITYFEDQEYYDGMAAELEELPEQLQADVLNIPYLEDEKMNIIAQGVNDNETSVKTDPISYEIGSIKQALKELGYTNKEINEYIYYAELLHDQQAYDVAMQEKKANAEENPVTASIGSVLGSSLGFLENVDSLGQKLKELITVNTFPSMNMILFIS